MNKKVVSVILLSLVLSSLIIGFVSAANGASQLTTGDTAEESFGNFIDFLLGDSSSPLEGNSLLFIKFLIAMIVVIFSFIALNSLTFFDTHKGLSFTLSLIAALLSIRFISGDGVISMIMLPYSALGILFSAGLPFVIVFIGIHKGLGDQPGIVRRVAWIFFGLIFLGIWVTRIGGFSNLSNIFQVFFGQGTEENSWYWVYFVTAILAYVMAIADGTIKGFFAKVQADRLKHTNRLEGMAQLKAELQDLEKMLKENTIDQETYKILKKDKQRRLQIISKK